MRWLVFPLLAVFPTILACAPGTAPTPAPSLSREQAIAAAQVFLFDVSMGTPAPSPALAAAARELVTEAGAIRGTWDAVWEPDRGAWLVRAQVEGRADPIELRLFEETLAVELAEPDGSPTE